jgi:hypothetical protein
MVIRYFHRAGRASAIPDFAGMPVRLFELAPRDRFAAFLYPARIGYDMRQRLKRT